MTKLRTYITVKSLYCKSQIIIIYQKILLLFSCVVLVITQTAEKPVFRL